MGICHPHVSYVMFYDFFSSRPLHVSSRYVSGLRSMFHAHISGIGVIESVECRAQEDHVRWEHMYLMSASVPGSLRVCMWE
jgi:hypothetical protein